MHRSTLLVFLPCAARDISAYDCFYGEDVEASDLHAPVQKLLVEFVWNLRRQIEGNKMCAELGNAPGENGEPMRREQGQEDALLWNALLYTSMHMASANSARG